MSDGILHSQYQDKSEVYHTILHEIGHAVALDHSPYREDIMYVPHQYGVSSLSQRDKTTLKWFYSFPCGKSINEILQEYKCSNYASLDRLVLDIESGKVDNKKKPKDKKETKTKSPDNEKKIFEDQEFLEKYNKYNMSLQNINVSEQYNRFLRDKNVKKEDL